MLKLIKTTVLDAPAASVTIDNIPQQFKTLKLVVSGRANSGAADSLILKPNGSTSSLSVRELYGNGTSAPSVNSSSVMWTGLSSGATDTANTFSNSEIVIPNYSSTTANKPVSAYGVSENNATTAFQAMDAGLWSNTAAITSIVLASASGVSFAAGTTVYLYGIA